MNLSLKSHECGYSYSGKDMLFSALTLSGAPYSKRHWELSRQPHLKKFSVGHRIIAIIEAIPIIGALAALIERLVIMIFEHKRALKPTRREQAHSRIFNPVRETEEKPRGGGLRDPVASTKNEEIEEKPEPTEGRVEKKRDGIWSMFSPEKQAKIEEFIRKNTLVKTKHSTPEESMVKNAKKAMEEGRRRDISENSAIYATPEEVGIDRIDTQPKSRQLTFSWQEYANKGPRESMQDAHFYREWDMGILTGVFDGHGGAKSGAQVAQHASTMFPERFEQALKDNGGDVHQTLISLFNQIHEELVDQFPFAGSTASVVYIEKKTHLAYIANLGDSDVTIYRPFVKSSEQAEGSSVVKAIPAACMRCWESIKDARRLAIIRHGEDGRGLADIAWFNIAKPSANPWYAKQLRLEVDKQLPDGRKYKNAINVSRSLGDKHFAEVNGHPGTSHKVKISRFLLLPGDNLMIASDGLRDTFKESGIVEMVSRKPDNIAVQLGELAVESMQKTHWGEDNVTILAILVGEEK